MPPQCPVFLAKGTNGSISRITEMWTIGCCSASSVRACTSFNIVVFFHSSNGSHITQISTVIISSPCLLTPAPQELHFVSLYSRSTNIRSSPVVTCDCTPSCQPLCSDPGCAAGHAERCCGSGVAAWQQWYHQSYVGGDQQAAPRALRTPHLCDSHYWVAVSVGAV